MKFEFDSPLNYTDGTVIDSTVAATMAYTIFVDTVTPPVKSYPVPASLVAAGTKNANGSVHVTVDCSKGELTGFTPVAGTTYYCAIEDSVVEGGQKVLSPESPVITYLNVGVPQTPANFSVAS